jgi:signal-transduction protein with cAMP-binding, CBS, and nucleotidyltransferase domain
LPVIADLLFNEYFLDDKLICGSQNLVKSIKERLSKMVEENDLIEALADQYEETLKETFQDEALQFYED